MKTFQNLLLDWYDQNARVLPWRDNPSPYRVWVSEIMLQQTRVGTVVPYYEKFLQELPDVASLAAVPEQKLIKLWEGLGYYSRALNLKKAAVIIMQQHEGRIPSDIKMLCSLPGIGLYTAGAVASIAYSCKVAAVDGNVLRVIARIYANHGEVTDPSVKKEMGQIVDQMLPNRRTGDFNQALMELGATICVPGSTPRCNICPVANRCEAYKAGISGDLPKKRAKKARKIQHKTVMIIKIDQKTAIIQRPPDRLLPGLYQFPMAEGHLSPEECRSYVQSIGIDAAVITPLKKAKHIFTHLEWHMIGYFIIAAKIGDNCGIAWATTDEIRLQYAIPSAFQAYMNL